MRVFQNTAIRERCIKNIIDLVVLKVLEKGPTSGYDIIAHVHNGFQILLSPGTVYPLLAVLENEGVVTSKIGGRKKIYSLTAKGTDMGNTIAHEYLKLYSKLSPSESDKSNRSFEEAIDARG
ncbi:MAG: PadR family transcriptional regulator [Candidatus Bathyarchaeia archaeon]